MCVMTQNLRRISYRTSLCQYLRWILPSKPKYLKCLIFLSRNIGKIAEKIALSHVPGSVPTYGNYKMASCSGLVKGLLYCGNDAIKMRQRPSTAP